MTIILSNVDSLFTKKYKANYSFESLKKINEYLNKYSSIDQVIDFFEKTFIQISMVLNLNLMKNY